MCDNDCSCSHENEKNFIEVKSSLNWDEYFMLQAMLASFKSKDPSTKVGCVIVDSSNHQVAMGYNGMVAGIDENQIPWGNDRTVPYQFQKYGYVIHAEANAILHCNVNLACSKVYVTLFPCNECAKMIATNKISEIIYLSDKYHDSPEIQVSKKILDLAGIKYRPIMINKSLLDALDSYLREMLTRL